MEIQPANQGMVTNQEFWELVQPLAREHRSEWWPESLGCKSVPPRLRARQPPNKSVYDPKIISLGPYHYGKPELREGEVFKYRSLDWFTEGDGNKQLHLYNKLLEKIRFIKYNYPVAIFERHDDKALALMMLLDGCFIINLMSSCTEIRRYSNNEYDWLNSRTMVDCIQTLICDVFVFENQIPFGVITLLMSLQGEKTAEDLVSKFVGQTLQQLDLDRGSIYGQHNDESSPEHILEACWRAFVGSTKLVLLKYDSTQERKTFNVCRASCHSVMDLKAKGIRFKPSGSHCVKDIRFNSHALYGQLELPYIYVSSLTHVILSNLIAFELSPHRTFELSPHKDVILIVLAYVIFMKSLIETPADVKELQREGILLSSSPNQEQAVQVFKDIDTFGYGDFDIYAMVKSGLDEHCRSRAKTWIADLIHTQSETPWTVIALCGAALLLILTSLQTYFTMYPRK